MYLILLKMSIDFFLLCALVRIGQGNLATVSFVSKRIYNRNETLHNWEKNWESADLAGGVRVSEKVSQMSKSELVRKSEKASMATQLGRIMEWELVERSIENCCLCVATISAGLLPTMWWWAWGFCSYSQPVLRKMS